MMYKDDLEAAMSRADALKAELERMKEEKVKGRSAFQQQQKRRNIRCFIEITFIIVGAIGGFGAVFYCCNNYDSYITNINKKEIEEAKKKRGWAEDYRIRKAKIDAETAEVMSTWKKACFTECKKLKNNLIYWRTGNFIAKPDILECHCFPRIGNSQMIRLSGEDFWVAEKEMKKQKIEKVKGK